MGPRVKNSTFHEFLIQGGLGGAEHPPARYKVEDAQINPIIELTNSKNSWNKKKDAQDTERRLACRCTFFELLGCFVFLGRMVGHVFVGMIVS